MSPHARGRLLGIPIGERSLATATERALGAIDARGRTFHFACAMAHSLNVAQTDAEFRAALCAADMLVADGAGVVAMARLAGVDVGTRMAGEQVFRAVMGALQARGGGRIFFFGSTERVLALMAERCARDYPALEVAGTLSPPYRAWTDAEEAAMAGTINRAQPDVLWVGLGAPKQEKWVHRNRARLQVPFAGSIGAVFDYFAGTNPAPPAWVRRWGLETPYRLALEPRRLWRRAILSNGQFVLRVLGHHVLRHGA